MLTIDRDMVLVAECRNGQIDQRRGVLPRLGLAVFDRPARVTILLAQLRGLVLPILWYAPLLDRLLLVRGVALLGSGYNGGVDDLSTHSKIAQRSQWAQGNWQRAWCLCAADSGERLYLGRSFAGGLID